jgi:hypothetical protein
MNIFLLTKHVTIYKKYQSTEKELSEIKQWNSHLDAVYYNKSLEAITEYYPIPDLIVWNESDEYCNISDILSLKNKMVFYFSEHHCFDCVKDALNQIKNIPDSITSNNYLILCNYPNMRHFQAFLREYDLKVPIYNICGQTLNLPVEKIESPFFFVVKSDLHSRQIFIPVKEIKRYLANYLQSMNKKYWMNSN